MHERAARVLSVGGCGGGGGGGGERIVPVQARACVCTFSVLIVDLQCRQWAYQRHTNIYFSKCILIQSNNDMQYIA